MKKGVLLGAAVFLAAVSLGYAAQQEVPTGELHGSIGVAYTSKYIWRGFDIFGDKSATHPFIDLDLFGTGLGFNITGHMANSDGYQNSERWDYMMYYVGSLYQYEPYQTDYRLGYVYYNYPDSSAHTTNSIDLQEAQVVFSWPNISPLKGLVPSYVFVKLWPSNSGTIVGARSPSGGTASGFAHIFMLDYALPVMCPFTNMERTLNIHSELVYNDGVGPNGANVDHDWSDAVVGISTNFDVAEDLVFTPGFFYQVTMDKSVDRDKDEAWVSLCMTYKF